MPDEAVGRGQWLKALVIYRLQPVLDARERSSHDNRPSLTTFQPDANSSRSSGGCADESSKRHHDVGHLSILSAVDGQLR